MQYLVIFFTSLILFTSCLGDKNESDFETFKKIDEAAIEKINEEQSLGLSKAGSGVYFKVTDSKPEGREIDAKVEVLIVYSLKTFSGNEILKSTLEDSTILNFFQDSAFPGFLAAIDELREGEKGLFYIPSTLAYQDQPIAGLNNWEPVILEIEIPRIYSESEQIDLYYHRKGVEPDSVFENGISVTFIDINQEGAQPTENSILNTTYVGTFLDDEVFDENNLELDLRQTTIIEGFREAAKSMKVGEKSVFVFPSRLAYGDQGFGGTVPPFTPLRFEIQLTSIR